MVRPTTLWTAAILGLWEGGYMVFDGVHNLTTGSYFGHRVGPWAAVVSAAGIDYKKMGVPFLVLGAAWLLGAALLLAGARVSRPLLLSVAVLSLFYLVFGTVISLAVIACLLSNKTKAALSGDHPGRMPR